MRNSTSEIQNDNERQRERDQALLVGLAQRDEGAAERFVHRFKPLLWSMARRYFPRTADAEDAMQDALIEIWKTAGRFDPSRGSAKTFVATLTRRRLIDRMRRQQSRPPLTDVPEATPSRSSSPERRAELSNVSSALAQLQPRYRRVLEMSLVEGYTHAEIADAMELPLGTVKSIARRSVRRVRADLHARAS